MHGVQVFSVDAKCVHSLSTRILSGGQAKSKMLMKEAVPSVTKEVMIFANPFDYVNYVKGLSGSGTAERVGPPHFFG